ncbi:hypothetical protein [Kitasatospora sp. NPDC097643]|uniref:hypothetical protein n=1 Tax=Kitasatospora sp. NPDC097643 TaxID=3157230 RepID=UPI00332AFBE2
MDESQSGGEITRDAAKGSPVRRGARLLRTARGGRDRAGRDWAGRDWAGWILTAAGAVLCVLGWYGVSGEHFVEQQVPYLASSTIPGAALLLAGVLLVALRPPPPAGRDGLTDQRVARLYELLVEPDGPTADPAGAATGATGWRAVPEGTHYHRPDCPLVAGKAQAEPVDAEAVRARGLTACPVCEPPPPSSPSPDQGAGRGTQPESPTRPGESAPPNG